MDVQVTTKERFEEINLGSNPQEPKHISISSKLSKEEKSELISLLKEFKDVIYEEILLNLPPMR